jgi:hypothetical protein
MIESNQLELKMNANLHRRPGKPLPRNRAKWWFDQMRNAANRASRWSESNNNNGSEQSLYLTQTH